MLFVIYQLNTDKIFDFPSFRHFILLPRLAMQPQSRKRKVATVSPPDRRGLRTPSPKRPRQNGVRFRGDEDDVEFVSEYGISETSCPQGGIEQLDLVSMCEFQIPLESLRVVSRVEL